MNKFIVFPVVMTDVVCGYSAIAIELTEANIHEIAKYRSVFLYLTESQKNVTEIVFGDSPIQIFCLNDKFNYDDKLKIVEISEDNFDSYSEYPEDENSEIDEPEIHITKDYFTIKCNSKHGIGELYTNVLFADLESVLTEIEEKV